MCSVPSAKTFLASPLFFLFSSKSRISLHSSSSSSSSKYYNSTVLKTIRASSSFIRGSISDRNVEALTGPRLNYGGVRLEEIVVVEFGKLRLDSWISSRVNGISRARVQSSIRSGLVRVNGRVVDKVIVFFQYSFTTYGFLYGETFELFGFD